MPTVSEIDSFIRNNIKQRNGDPTDAYGQIEFGNNNANIAAYVKVSDTTSVEIIYQLMTKHWKLKTPNLIISVTGGAKNFSLRKRLKEVFRRSLIKASETTGAWITTGGTRAGVMKHVGKAVEEYAAIKDDEKQRVVTVGVVPWGVLRKRDVLLNQLQGNQAPKVYDAEEGFEGSGTLLDHNHSHFILVDNGMDDSIDNPEDIYGTEIRLRTALEGHIGRQQTSRRVNVLIVCVIVQGGPNSLETVAASIRHNTPVVLVEGSGGWADVLASASTMRPRQINRDTLAEMISDCGMEVKEDHLDCWTEVVKECISNKDLLKVFSLDPTDLSRDLDIAILEVLLKATSNDADLAQTQQQLQLAIAWNRSDIAQSHILNDDACIPKRAIAKLFCEVLEGNKHEFCRVFLNFGVDLKAYFTVKDLHSLYKSAPRNLVFYKKLCKRDFSLQSVGELLLDYLGQSYISIYKKRRRKVLTKYCAICEENNRSNTSVTQSVEGWSYRCKLDDPYREIFQWAILFNYREIAMHVFEYMYGSTQAAIMASRMLKVLASQMGRDQETRLQMEADANEYETLAMGIFAKCFTENRSKSFSLLIAKLPKWGGYTCLQVAIKADDKRFVSSPAVQKFLDEIWTSKLSGNRSLHIILAGVVPPLILMTIGFREKEDDETSGAVENRVLDEEDCMELMPVPNIEDEEHSVGIPSFNDPDPKLAVQKEYSFMQKLVIFYDAPIVTFWLNVVFFLVYLGLFAFVVLSDFQLDKVSVSLWEYLLLAWTSTFLLEEFGEVITQEARYLQEKILIHMKQAWNVMDLVNFVSFYVGFGLRYDIRYLEVSLTLYAIAFMVQCIRLVRIFAVHPLLGPKIIMVGKMLKDLLFFLFIVIVFLMAYGVASQALLYPGQTDLLEIVIGIIYRPYWQIYGELFLNEINYDSSLNDFKCSDADVGLPRCPRSTPVVPIMSALYMLFANVLLLNLLIAMFSYTFEKVESRNKEIWMFQRYKLITDYYFRPPLVPPFIILSHIHLLLSFVFRKIVCGSDSDEPFRRTLKTNLDSERWRVLSQWEHWHANEFVREKRQDDGNKVDQQLKKINFRMDLEARKRVSSHNQMNKLIKRRFNQLERMISGTPKKSTTKAPTTPGTPKSRNIVRDELPVHVKARCAFYPDSDQKKVVVPDDKVSWKVEWKDYNPPVYTHPTVAAHPPWADEDLEKYDVESRPELPYNIFDQAEKVLRKSHTATYLVIDGIPRNSMGRTGIQGRGLLGRYGPNHAADTVVTRWKRNTTGDIMKIDDKPVLEFVAIRREDTGEWAIPGGMVGPGEPVSQTLKREFGEEALDLEEIDVVERENIEILFKSGGLELYRGYCDDHRNTDNAWVETVACNFHDEIGDAFSHVAFSPREGETRAVSWVEVNHKLKLFASHNEYLKKSAQLHNAYF